MSSGDSNGVGISANLDTEVGRVVVDLGLATKTEVEFCREQQKQSSDPNQRSLADLLIENQFITSNQAKRIRGSAEERKNTKQIPGYQILGMLGKGAMATVYKARQVSLNRVVALKILSKRLDNPEFVERFYKEGQAAARLSHNNIVQAIDVGSTPDGQFHYFVMEYIEGKTLYDIMQPPPVGEGRTFSEAEALDITIQITDALVHAHQRGLIHRDIKPKNIMLTPQGVAKLTDLGLARAVDDKATAEIEAGKAYGTPYYISPEQIRGDVDIDFRADIYSLGATLYHMVTGHPPFEADTPSAVMHKHLKQRLVPADHVNQALSAGIGEIIDVCMAKKREERYQNTENLMEDLKAVRNHQPPIHARRSVDLDALSKLEETGKTVDLAPEMPERSKSIWHDPLVMAVLCGLGVSVIANLVMLVVLVLKSHA